MKITYELADFVASTAYEDLPERVVERVKVHALDALASGFVGARLPWATIVAEMVSEQGGVGEASVFGQKDRVTASQAALLNGVMISGFEAEHSGHLSHSAATATPAAIAIGERERKSGKDLVTALALGSETGCRIGLAQTRAVEDERGFHNPGVNGPFTAAAAAGRLLGLDSTTQARAFGIAGSHSAGLVEYAWDGSMTKRLHLGRASQLGLESAVLASKGFTGPITVIEGSYGLLHAFSPSPKPELALADLGREWRFETTMIKPYAVHGSGQMAVAAVQELKGSNTIDLNAISSVKVRSSDHRVLETRFRDPAPNNLLGAQCSLPFTTAVALVRNLDDPLQYDETIFADESILRIAPLVAFDFLEGQDGPLHLELEVTAGGETVAVHTGPYRGSIVNPATFEDMEDKFHRYSRHLVDQERRHRIIAIVRDLETLPDVGQLAEALRL